MAIAIPFPLPSTGYALNSKVRVNLDFIVDQFNSFSAGGATWDALYVGTAGSLTGTLNFYNSANGYTTTVKPATTMAGNLTFTLPPTDGASGDVLVTDGTGVLTWSTLSSANTALSNLASVAINTALLPEASNTKDLGSAGFPWREVFVKTNLILQETGTGTDFVGIQAPAAITSSYYIILPAAAPVADSVLKVTSGGVGSWDSTIANAATKELDNLGTTSISVNLLPSARDVPNLGSSSLPWNSLHTDRVLIYDEASPWYSVELQAPTLAASYTLTLPVDDGAADQVLKTNGSGVLSWVDQASTASFATVTLNNVGSTAIPSDLLPETTGTKRLGNDTKLWMETWAETGWFGASGNDGAIAIYPPTGSSGRLQFKAGNCAGDYIIWVTNASQSGNRTYTIPDAGASAYFVMSQASVTLPTTNASGVLTNNGSGTLTWEATGSGANAALSNLASVAINTTLVSDTTNTDDLGSSSVVWRSGYFGTSIYNTATSNQLVLGTTRTVTLTAPTPATASRTVTFPDLSADYSVVGTAGTQTIGGSKTFSATTNVGEGGTGSTNAILILNGSSASSYGTQLRFSRESVLKATIGHYGSIFGGTSSDLCLYSPSDDVIINTGGTDRMRILAAGEITQPSQPSFLATAPVNTANVTGDGTAVTVEFDSEVYDQGSDFNTSTYQFTAPVTGKYQLQASVLLQDTSAAAGHTYGQLTIVTSNRNYLHYIHRVDDSYQRLVVTALADMDASDVAYVNVVVAAGTKVVEPIDDSGHNYFSGSLIN